MLELLDIGMSSTQNFMFVLDTCSSRNIALVYDLFIFLFLIFLYGDWIFVFSENLRNLALDLLMLCWPLFSA